VNGAGVRGALSRTRRLPLGGSPSTTGAPPPEMLQHRFGHRGAPIFSNSRKQDPRLRFAQAWVLQLTSASPPVPLPPPASLRSAGSAPSKPRPSLRSGRRLAAPLLQPCLRLRLVRPGSFAPSPDLWGLRPLHPAASYLNLPPSLPLPPHISFYFTLWFYSLWRRLCAPLPC
jgi:hypothetical protein